MVEYVKEDTDTSGLGSRERVKSDDPGEEIVVSTEFELSWVRLKGWRGVSPRRKRTPETRDSGTTGTQ